MLNYTQSSEWLAFIIILFSGIIFLSYVLFIVWGEATCFVPTVCRAGLWDHLSWPHSPAFAFPSPHRPSPALVPGLILKMARVWSEDRDCHPDPDLRIKLCSRSTPTGHKQEASKGPPSGYFQGIVLWYLFISIIFLDIQAINLGSLWDLEP